MLWTTSSVLFVASFICVQAAMFVASPLEWAMRDVSKVGGQGQAPVRASRFKRNVPDGMPPCVSVTYLTELQHRFRTFFDHNSDGVATLDEVKNFIKQFKPQVQDDAVRSFIGRRDMNGDGAIEFIPEYVTDLIEQDFTLDGAKEWFYLQDVNDDGQITPDELIKVAKAMGMSEQHAWEPMVNYYMSYDTNKDGKLSFDEFKLLYVYE